MNPGALQPEEKQDSGGTLALLLLLSRRQRNETTASVGVICSYAFWLGAGTLHHKYHRCCRLPRVLTTFWVVFESCLRSPRSQSSLKKSPPPSHICGESSGFEGYLASKKKKKSFRCRFRTPKRRTHSCNWWPQRGDRREWVCHRNWIRANWWYYSLGCAGLVTNHSAMEQ